MTTLLEDTAAAWSHFEQWSETQGVQSFPASVEMVLRFLHERPIQGPPLYEAWRAISARHEAHYWHTDVNPVQLLRLGGVTVEPDGSVRIPESVSREFGL